MKRIIFLITILFLFDYINPLDIKLYTENDSYIKEVIVENSKKEELNYKTYFLKGKENLKNNNIKAAIINFSKSIELNPNYWEAYKERASAKDKIGDFTGSQKDYEKYTLLLNQQNAHQNEIIRKDIDNIMKGAYKKINEKKYNEAITILNNVIDTYPKFPDGYIAKADINFILKNYKNSLIDYNKAINLGNSTPELYLKIANTQYNLGLFKDAASNYIQFLRINPQDEYAYYRLMGSYIFIEDFKKAFDYLQKYKDYSITKDIQISDFNEWDNILNKYKKYDLIRDLENGLKSLKFVQEKKQI